MPVFKRNDVEPDRFFAGDIGRVLAPGDEVEAETNPDWQYFDETPFGTVVTPPEAPPVVEETPAEPAA
jgi:hypothetical protein